MKKLLLCVLTFTLLTGCQDNNQNSVDLKMSVFKKNTETNNAPKNNAPKNQSWWGISTIENSFSDNKKPKLKATK